MTFASFDTHEAVTRLKQAGVPEQQAEGIVTILRDLRELDRSDLATKADIERLESKLEILRRDITIRLGGMLVVATGVLLAAKFFG